MSNNIIGVMGGMGPQASVDFYKKLIDLAQLKFDAAKTDDYPEIIIHSIPAPNFTKDAANKNTAMEMFGRVLSDFEHAGVSYVVMACNAVHIYVDEIRSFTDLPLLSMIDAVVERVRNDNRKKVGLLANPLTYQTGLYSGPLEAIGVEVVAPDKEGIAQVNAMIDLIIANKNDDEVKKEYIKVINRMLQQKCEAIVVGCTELPFAINYAEIVEAVYKSTDILAEKVLDLYYQDK